MNEFEKKALKAKKAMEFLDWHPALSASPMGEVTRNLIFGIESVCKRGEWESSKGLLSIGKGDKDRNWEKFKDELDKEEKHIEESYGDEKDIKMNKAFLHINKTYEEVYGEKWKFDHIIYWYEISFSVFKGKIGTKEWMDFNHWDNFQGFHGHASTFEDMMIEIAKKAKNAFGNFKIYDNNLLSKKEIENHKEEECFFFTPCKDKKGYRIMNHNKKYFDVHNDLYNLRWLRKFVDTNYCKKHWKNEFDWIKKVNLYPNG